MPTDEDQRQLSQAKKVLVGDCMAGFGFTWSPAPDLPKVGPKTLTDWRYGIHDMDLAKKRGYKPDAREQADYDAAVNKGAVDGSTADDAAARALDGRTKEVGGKKVPEGGCVGQANRKINAGAAESRAAIDLANGAFIKAKQDPKVVKAFADWSVCMKKTGYDYAEPLDASDDSRFSAPEVTSEEIATATADITCRDRTDVARLWFEAEAALQQQAIDDNAEQLDGNREAMDSAVREAARISTGTSGSGSRG